MVQDARFHAPSRANFIKLASLLLKLCTEAWDSVLKAKASAHNRWLQTKPQRHNPEITFIFSPPLLPLLRVIFYQILHVLKI